MNYPELCRVLQEHDGRVPLWDARYPTLGAPYAELAEAILRATADGFEVGILDRGNFVLAERFASEDKACEFIYRKLHADHPVHRQTPEERQRGDEITAEFVRKFLSGELEG